MELFNKFKYIWNRQSYIRYWKKSSVKNNYIFLESQQGKNFNGNIFYIAQELCSSLYQSYEVYLSCTKEKKQEFIYLLNQYHLDHIQLVELGSKKYYTKLSESKYLFNDTSFLTFFIKKSEQVYINTWHGTPLKTLGKFVSNDKFNIGNIQKNFLSADYILTPNYYTQEKLIESYMLKEMYNGKFLKCGYPRNSVFFNEKRRQYIRNKMNIADKQVIAYMPTWRGIVGRVEQEIDFMDNLLKNIDDKLNETQIMYINLHPFMNTHISFSQFQHLKEFPKNYETYDFLNATDCLITDYSSVFFDYANTGRKIILYVPDKDVYEKERGLYLNLDDLPFPKIYDTDNLILEINNDLDNTFHKFLKEFCSLDSKEVVSHLCQHIIFHKSYFEEDSIKKNGKKNVLIFAGRMVNNGITTSLINLLNCIDQNKYNIVISLTAHNNEEGKEILKKLPEYVCYYPHSGKMIFSLFQFIYLGLYYFRLIPRYKSDDIMNSMFEFEYKRLYQGMQFDSVIHFRGYVFFTMWLFNQFQCKKSIFVHNDMIQEMRNKNNQHPWTLEYIYKHFDKVAVVSEDIRESTSLISNRFDNIQICKNIIDFNSIKLKGNKDIVFDEFTEANIDYNLLIQKIQNNAFTFVNVGRFSKEKGQMRLLEVFKKVHQEYPNTQLLIIGGYGKLYSSLLNEITKQNLSDCVFIVKNLSNPLPFVKKCDGFVLSSFYEGFGLVLAEANILGVPMITTDIVGPKEFMKKYKGHIYPNNIEGIYQGMIDLYNREIEIIDVDYVKYNQEAVEEFYSLIDC